MERIFRGTVTQNVIPENRDSREQAAHMTPEDASELPRSQESESWPAVWPARGVLWLLNSQIPSNPAARHILLLGPGA